MRLSGLAGEETPPTGTVMVRSVWHDYDDTRQLLRQRA